MRGLQRHCSARILATRHAFVQNLRRGHYDHHADGDTKPGRNPGQ
jgi:hypothetical protein